jgi:hypothetical protein
MAKAQTRRVVTVTTLRIMSHLSWRSVSTRFMRPEPGGTAPRSLHRFD